MTLTNNDKELLGRHGWTIECELPPEIVHQDESRATGRAITAVLLDLNEQEQEAAWNDDDWDDEDEDEFDDDWFDHEDEEDED